MKKLQQIRNLRKQASHMAFYDLADALYTAEQKRCSVVMSDEEREMCHAINGPTCLLSREETV